MEADTSDREGDGDLVEQAYQYITAGTWMPREQKENYSEEVKEVPSPRWGAVVRGSTQTLVSMYHLKPSVAKHLGFVAAVRSGSLSLALVYA